MDGTESFRLVPKILGKIENTEQGDGYWIGGNTTLSKEEALKWAHTNRLDAIIVHERGGSNYLRSRPDHRIQHLHLSTLSKQASEAPLTRIVGVHKAGQCVWAFINGISNSKEDALQAANKISAMAGGERVIAMQNDTKGWNGAIDFGECILLKASLKLPIIDRAINFLHYLLALSKEENAPIIIFAHSQGGIILEHAITFLTHSEANQLRTFTFGGGSFIQAGKTHPESHNYASVADFVCLGGSPNIQTLALKRYYAHKEGLSDYQLTERLAIQDALLELAPCHYTMVKKFVEDQVRFYNDILHKISNITILDPDPDKRWKHEFFSDCYQRTVEQIIENYQR